MHFSILLSFVGGGSLVLASRLPVSSYSQPSFVADLEDARFNRNILGITPPERWDAREINFQRFLQVSNSSQLFRFFSENLNVLIANMPQIRMTINSDALFVGLLINLLKLDLELRHLDAILVEFCAIYKARPDTIDMSGVLRQVPLLVSYRIGFISLSLENFTLVDGLIRSGKFNLNSLFSLQEGFKGNAVIVLRSPDCVRFALENGLDFNAPVILPDGKEVTSLGFFLMQRQNRAKEIVNLLLATFPFTNEVFSRAVHELAPLGYIFAYFPINNGPVRLKLFKAQIPST